MSVYREVTKDDVGKMVEVRDKEAHDWKVRELEHILSRPGDFGQRYLVWGEDKQYPLQYRYARIRTSLLPDGWLPDDWRVLWDEEICNKHDLVVWEAMLESKFTLGRYGCYCDGEYTGRTAKFIVDGVDCNLCVIRPRWRPATKDDVNKIGISKHGDSALIKAIVERDAQGYDAWCLHDECGWCVARLSDLKVENEGWHVTN